MHVTLRGISRALMATVALSMIAMVVGAVYTYRLVPRSLTVW